MASCSALLCCSCTARCIVVQAAGMLRPVANDAMPVCACPLQYPDLAWDFRLKNVASINASGHK